jgi:hypothetical protein
MQWAAPSARNGSSPPVIPSTCNRIARTRRIASATKRERLLADRPESVQGMNNRALS